MANEQLAVVELITDIMLGKTSGVSRVDFFTQKIPFPFDEPYEQPFERATPESQGVSSAHLAALLRELDASKYTDMHHFMLLRHGKVICECNFAPYPKGLWHISHSMCKSITGMAIGLLVEEGLLRLDDNIYSIFENKINPLTKMFRPVITVENLLTMTSGVSFNESGIVSGNDWLGSYLNSAVTEDPGTVFHYNSLNTYVLSAIVTERTGLTLEEYLRPRLFEPLGITKILWEVCPKGITKGGWGLFICTEDMAKLGQLYLQKGVWNGRQIIPADWVERSTKKQVETDADTFGYGYQLWMEERPGSFEFNGMLGQNVVVYPDMDMVLVTNAGNNELFQNCVMLNIVRKYFPLARSTSDTVCPDGYTLTDSRSPLARSTSDTVCPDGYMPTDALPENQAALSVLLHLVDELESGLKKSSRIKKGGWLTSGSVLRRNSRLASRFDIRQGNQPTYGCNLRQRPQGLISSTHVSTYSFDYERYIGMLDGKEYTLAQQSVGLFPLFLQVFHNNMTEGIHAVKFSREGMDFLVSFLEADTWHDVKVGFGLAKESLLTLHGESYLLATRGRFTTDENDNLVLKLEMAYVEESVKRLANIFFFEDGIEIRWFETPGKSMIMEGLESVTEELADHFLYNALKERGGMEILHRLMNRTIEPIVHGNLAREAENTLEEIE